MRKIILLGTLGLMSAAPVSFAALQANQLTDGQSYPCFIRADSNLTAASFSCTGDACQVNCTDGSCIAFAGELTTDYTESVACSLSVTYSNGEQDTLTHTADSNNYDAPTSGLTTALDTSSSYANKVCPNGFSDCAYWTVNG